MPLSLDQLIALPYGDGIPQTKPIGDLLALPYSGGSSYSKGMVAKDYRRNMRDHGERVLWLRALEGGDSRQGLRFVEQPLGSIVRVFIYENRRDVKSEDIGQIATGETRLSWMPDEISPLRDDRFVALDRTFEARQTIQPTGEITEALDHKQLASLTAVYQGNDLVSATNYALVNGGLMWINGYLPQSEVVAVYDYRPTYELLGEGWKQGPLGADGRRLPSSVPLRLLTAGEE